MQSGVFSDEDLIDQMMTFLAAGTVPQFANTDYSVNFIPSSQADKTHQVTKPQPRP